MGDPSHLLDELARVYARAAVDELLVQVKDGRVGTSPEDTDVTDDATRRPLEPSTLIATRRTPDE